MMEIFVPGRLCLLGEHTDWASGYRRHESNSCLSYGLCLVCATNEGLYARVTSLSTPTSQIIYKRLSPTGDSVMDEMSWSWKDTDSLQTSATSGSFLAYVAGSILSFISYLQREHPDIDLTKLPGVEIINYKTTLPMKRGLSSSAAVCTMIVRSLALHLSIDLSLDEIMAISYEGERNTPSQCGMMDFCVAMGPNRVGLMIMNDSSCELKVISIAQPLYFVVANLNAGKDTVQILRDLNSAFPFPSTQQACLLHEYVSCSQTLCWRATRAISVGNIAILASAMNDAQIAFDKSAMYICPEQLTSPKLHSVISFLLAQDSMELGALAVKGVGSQGDGSVQVLCKDNASQQAILSVLQDKFSCDGFVLTLPPSETSLKETGSTAMGNLDIPDVHVHEITVGILVLPLSMEELVNQTGVNKALMSFVIDAIGCGIRRMIILNPESSNKNRNHKHNHDRHDNDFYSLMTVLSESMQTVPDTHYDLLSDVNQKPHGEWEGYEGYIRNRLYKYCRLVHVPSGNSHQKKRTKVEDNEKIAVMDEDTCGPESLSSAVKMTLRDVQASLQVQVDSQSMRDTNYCVQQKVLFCRWREVSDESQCNDQKSTKSSTYVYDGSHTSYGGDVSMFELMKKDRDGVNPRTVIQFGEGGIGCAQICEWDHILS